MKGYRKCFGKLCLMLSLAFFIMVGGGCGKKEEKGPAEQIGKEIDKAVEQAGEAVKDAVDEAKEATKK